LLDCWQYHIDECRDVVIVTYGCHVLSTDPPVVSDEHKRAGLFAPNDVLDLAQRLWAFPQAKRCRLRLMSWHIDATLYLPPRCRLS